MHPVLHELVEVETAGWQSLCDGFAAEFYAAHMTDDARMVLAGGVIMTRTEVADALQHAPPWASFTIDAPVVTSLGDDVAMLTYTGTGHRADGDDFTAIMTTVYVNSPAGWRIAHYQQTPLG
jgi:uncharacterized protein (TIGR02246 family)